MFRKISRSVYTNFLLSGHLFELKLLLLIVKYDFNSGTRRFITILFTMTAF